MIKSVLAVSEGGPDATMSFRLAVRVAANFDGTVDALHLPVGPAGGMVGGLAVTALLATVNQGLHAADGMSQGVILAFAGLCVLALVSSVAADSGTRHGGHGCC